MGDAVVVTGHGVGRVAARDEQGRLIVRLREGEVAVAPEDVEALLRPVVAAETARAHLARLCERCDEERTFPEVRSHRELARAPLERKVEYLRWYFRKRKALQPRECDLLLALSEPVLAELATALGVEESDVTAAVKCGKPDLTPGPARVLPIAPPLVGFEHLRSFWLGAVAIVGESPEHDGDVVKLPVKPGAWHAYVSEDADADDEDAFDGVLLRHHDGSERTAADATLRVGEVNLEGGRLGVLDAAALTDPVFGLDGVERTRREGEGYGDRGVETSTYGDGGHTVLVDRDRGATVIALPF